MITSMDRRSRFLARLFAVCGILLVPWIGLMIWQLHGQAGKRSFSSSWVGLEVLEAVCLLIVAALLSRRHPATSPAAATGASAPTATAAPAEPHPPPIPLSFARTTALCPRLGLASSLPAVRTSPQ